MKEKTQGIFQVILAMLTVLILFNGCVFYEHSEESPYSSANTTNTVAAETTTTINVQQGPASDKVVFKKISVENATAALLSGEIDYYLSSLTPEQALESKDDPRINLYYAASQINGIVLNPAPAATGDLNPFSLQKVRFAMHYLIDREAIVNEAQSGFGIPIVTNLIPTHPSYEFVKGVIENYNITYDREKASQMITESLLEAGAKKIDGKWTYNGKNIQLKVIIPTYYSEMKGIGEKVSSELEKVGFTVDRLYLNRSDDRPSYMTDPAELKWNVDVTAWIFYGHSKYESAGFPELETKEGWWAYNNTEINAVVEKFQNYSSKEEWEQLNNEYAKMSIFDAVGIWLTAKNNVFAARSDVQGLTDDRFVGLRSYGNIREAYVPGEETLSVGAETLYYHGDSWNPVVIEHVNIMDVVNTLNDPANWDDPITLEKRPFRIGYSIETKGSDTKLEVPEDAFVWDSDSNTWNTVGKGKTAKTKITYDLSKYIGAKWHHQIEISWADVLYSFASYWDMSYDTEKQKISSPRWRDSFSMVKGLRIVDNELEVYFDKWSFDDDELLNLNFVFLRSAPWELFAAMDKTVYEGKELVYDIYSLPEGMNATAMVLINSSHVKIVIENLDKLKYSEIAPFMTVSGKSYASEEELAERTKAIKEWNEKYNHLIIGNGPFYLTKYNPSDGSLELSAFRDLTYPFKKGDWLVEEPSAPPSNEI